ncbi:uncharacterized protein LOC144440682 [Glandiceps talaboti]
MQQKSSLHSSLFNIHRCEGSTKSAECEWYYTGTGYEYQLLAGPLFNVIFSFTGVPVGLILERNRNNRKNVIALCSILWSLMVVFGGLATHYWHLAVTRLAIALFEAAFSAFAVSLIGSYFPAELRAMAMGIFMWGVYFGYSMAFIMKLVTNTMGWRQAYFLTGVPGIILGLLCYYTVTEPAVEHLEKSSSDGSLKKKDITPGANTQMLAPAPLINPVYIMLLLASAVRCGGGYVFGYNINNYMSYAYPGYPIENFLSWIPALTGVFGSVVGGVTSDRIATHGGRGFIGRMYVTVISVFLSIPFALLVLIWAPPWCFIILIPGYFVNEMWGAIVMTAVLEQAPPSRQTTAMAIYVFTINIIGGNMTLLVPSIRAAFGWDCERRSLVRQEVFPRQVLSSNIATVPVVSRRTIMFSLSDIKPEEFKSVEYTTKDKVAYITLNRPHRLNALDEYTPQEIFQSVQLANSDDNIKVIVLSGKGRAFSAGYDLKKFAEADRGTVSQKMPWDPYQDFKQVHSATEAYMSLWKSYKPTICKIHGFCVAGGSDLALCTDIIIMAEDAKIGYPPIRVWGCPHSAMWAYRMGAEKAKRMLLTGDLIDGIEAAKLGLVLKAVPADQLDAEVNKLVQRMVNVPSNQLFFQKQVINQAVEHMGLSSSQRLASIFDGMTRHSPEGIKFQQRAADIGFKQAVKERDSGDETLWSDLNPKL